MGEQGVHVWPWKGRGGGCVATSTANKWWMGQACVGGCAQIHHLGEGGELRGYGATDGVGLEGPESGGRGVTGSAGRGADGDTARPKQW